MSAYTHKKKGSGLLPRGCSGSGPVCIFTRPTKPPPPPPSSSSASASLSSIFAAGFAAAGVGLGAWLRAAVAGACAGASGATQERWGRRKRRKGGGWNIDSWSWFAESISGDQSQQVTRMQHMSTGRCTHCVQRFTQFAQKGNRMTTFTIIF